LEGLEPGAINWDDLIGKKRSLSPIIERKNRLKGNRRGKKA